ncbi:MAG: hypothetical protein ACE5HZ_01885 [Fidelibacterota bacterium]
MKLQPAAGFLVLLTLLGAQKGRERATEDILFEVGNINRMDVTISTSLGSLTLSPNPDTNQIAGKIYYHPALVTPRIEYDTMGSRGELDIRAEHGSEFDFDEEYSFPKGLEGRWKDLEGKKYHSELDLRLPPGIPMNMNLKLGLGEADLDLTRLTISDLQLECGLSDVDISMESANTVRSRTLTIETGLGELTARHLGNLKAKTIRVEVGLGSADLDLSGDEIEDTIGRIEVGLGSLNLILPRRANIRLEIDKSFLSSVDVDDLTQEGDVWVSDRWEPDRPTLDLEISVSLGSVDVDVK